jgi:hypothetical protein
MGEDRGPGWEYLLLIDELALFPALLELEHSTL